MEEDNVEYVIQPSQWVNIVYVAMAIAMMYLFWDYPIAWGLFVVMLIWRILDIYFWRYEIREMTLVERRGVLSVTKEEVNYYRIKSIKVEEPFFMRLVGLSNITVITSEALKPEIKLYAISNGDVIRNLVKNKTYYWKQRMNIRDVDIFNPNDV